MVLQERFYFGLAVALGSRVFCSPEKRKTLSFLDLPPAWLVLLSDDSLAADVHLLGQSEALKPESLCRRLEDKDAPWAAVVGFRATGWSHRNRRPEMLSIWREGRASVVGVPYSEHSSWTDLRSCVALLKPGRLVPTANAASELIDFGSGAWSRQS